MTQPNFIKDAEEQAELGFGPRAVDFLVRLDPKEAKPADAVIKQLIEDWDENFLLEVASDAEKLRLKLDDAGVDLVVHAVSRCIKPGTRELELFLQHDIVTLSLQDSKGNCALHYLAWNGVDLLGQLPIRRLLIRNLNGATPLHLQAKKQVARERILALPTEILKLKTKRGATIESALESQPHEPILQEVAQAQVAGEDTGAFTSPDDIPGLFTIDRQQFVRRGSRAVGDVLLVSFIDASTLNSPKPVYFEVSFNRAKKQFVVSAISEKRRATKTFDADELSYKLLRSTVSDLFEANHVQSFRSKPVVGRVAAESSIMDWNDFIKLNSLSVGRYKYERVNPQSDYNPTFVGTAFYHSTTTGKGSAEIKIMTRRWGGPKQYEVEFNVSTWVSTRTFTVDLPFRLSAVEQRLSTAIDSLLSDHGDSMFAIGRAAGETSAAMTMDDIADLGKIKAGGLTFTRHTTVKHAGSSSARNVTFVAPTELGDLFVYFSDNNGRIELHGAMSKAIDVYNKRHIDGNLNAVKDRLADFSKELMEMQRRSTE